MHVGRTPYVLAIAVAGVGVSFSPVLLAAEGMTPTQGQTTVNEPRSPLLGIGYHPGHFVGPLAFDIIVRPLPHLALDLQAGTGDFSGHRVALAPQIQWEIFKRPSTPYLGAVFRYERYTQSGQHAESTGGALTAGWQWRWQSGLGLLLGIGVLYRTPVDFRTPTLQIYSAGGWGGTYEIGLRYFFF